MKTIIKIMMIMKRVIMKNKSKKLKNLIQGYHRTRNASVAQETHIKIVALRNTIRI